MHSGGSAHEQGSFLEESSLVDDDEEREMTIEDLLSSMESPGLKMAAGGFDLPLIRDK